MWVHDALLTFLPVRCMNLLCVGGNASYGLTYQAFSAAQRVLPDRSSESGLRLLRLHTLASAFGAGLAAAWHAVSRGATGLRSGRHLDVVDVVDTGVLCGHLTACRPCSG